jgi:hypothetical protein
MTERANTLAMKEQSIRYDLLLLLKRWLFYVASGARVAVARSIGQVLHAALALPALDAIRALIIDDRNPAKR